MADQTANVLKTEAGITGYFVTLNVVVTTNDTFKIRDLTLVQGAVALKVADWSEVSLTYTGNVVTVTQASLSTTPIVVLVGGQK